MSETNVPLPGKAALYRVTDLLPLRFRIPSFQRPYDWHQRQVEELVVDLADSANKGRPLFLGMLVLAPQENSYLVIDGQQRLTTLMLALAAGGGLLYVLDDPRRPDQRLWVYPREEDTLFIERVMNGTAGDHESLSQRLLQEAYEHLKSSVGLSLSTLLDCELIVYVAPKISGATALFERINTRGRNVSQFDLVKNKLIDWCGAQQNKSSPEDLVRVVDRSYDRLYRLLNPSGHSEAYPTERLLRVHWILFDPAQFKSSERVIEKLDLRLQQARSTVGGVEAFIRKYLDSLLRVAECWVKVERPRDHPAQHQDLHEALLDFKRLDREAEFQPLMVSTMLRFPEEECVRVVKMASTMSFRDGLAKRRGNYGRAPKWRMARDLYHHELTDALLRPVACTTELVNQLYWATGSWWDEEEALELMPEAIEPPGASDLASTAFASPKFYSEFRHLIHYFFWNFACAIDAGRTTEEVTKVQLTSFNQAGWEQFRGWDIEHIYPQSPENLQPSDRAHKKLMAAYTHHLGNLTVLPKSENRSLRNVNFSIKRAALREVFPLNVNELLDSPAHRGNLQDKPYWGPHNCKRRMRSLLAFAREEWGPVAVRELGVREHDESVDHELGEDDDDAVDGVESSEATLDYARQ